MVSAKMNAKSSLAKKNHGTECPFGARLNEFVLENRRREMNQNNNNVQQTNSIPG